MRKLTLLCMATMLCFGCFSENSDNKVSDSAENDTLAINKERADKFMGMHGVDLSWQKQTKYSIGFDSLIDETIAFKGYVKDVYIENNEPYAMIYDMGNIHNSFLAYVKLSTSQLKAITLKKSARGTFIIHVDGIKQGRPEIKKFDSDNGDAEEVLTRPIIVKIEAHLMDLYLNI